MELFDAKTRQKQEFLERLSLIMCSIMGYFQVFHFALFLRQQLFLFSFITILQQVHELHNELMPDMQSLSDHIQKVQFSCQTHNTTNSNNNLFL